MSVLSSIGALSAALQVCPAGSISLRRISVRSLHHCITAYGECELVRDRISSSSPSSPCLCATMELDKEFCLASQTHRTGQGSRSMRRMDRTDQMEVSNPIRRTTYWPRHSRATPCSPPSPWSESTVKVKVWSGLGLLQYTGTQSPPKDPKAENITGCRERGINGQRCSVAVPL